MMTAPTTWRDRLRNAIREIIDRADWEETAYVVPDWAEPEIVRSRHIDVATDCFDYAPGLAVHIGRVNAAEFCGAPPGTLIVSGADWTAGEPVILRFGLRDRPWSYVVGADGRHRERCDDDDNPLFPSADFDEVFDRFDRAGDLARPSDNP